MSENEANGTIAKETETTELGKPIGNIPHRNKNTTKIFLIGIAAIFIVVICMFTLFRKPTINLNDYITVSFKGYDTIGTASASFNETKFRNDYNDILAKKHKEANDPYAMWKNMGATDADCFLMYIDGKLTKTSGLSNNDTITYKWNCNSEVLQYYDVNLQYENIDYVVNGLKEVGTFDAFENVSLLFEGVAPNGTASVIVNGTSEAESKLKYSVNPSSGLNIGDKVTVSISASGQDATNYCINNFGMMPEKTSEEYTVTGLARYASSMEDISDTAMEAMKRQAEDVYQSIVASKWSSEHETLISFDYKGNYFLTAKSDSVSPQNKIYLVYDVAVRDYYEFSDEVFDKTTDFLWCIEYDDIYVDQEGNTSVDTTKYNKPSGKLVTVESGHTVFFVNKNWTYNGFSDEYQLYQYAVSENLEHYNHIDNIGET